MMNEVTAVNPQVNSPATTAEAAPTAKPIPYEVASCKESAPTGKMAEKLTEHFGVTFYVRKIGGLHRISTDESLSDDARAAIRTFLIENGF